MTLDKIIRADWLAASATQSVFAALQAGGFEARAVGGIVRNTLLGRPATDIDIATTAKPGETIAAATAAGLKTYATGLAHGTVTVVSGGVPYEVTTLRRDVATDGRHAEVEFTDDWAADAARRDFTINALYCGRDGRIFDPLGGVADLEPVRVRFIGRAEQRIGEDFLRILRFFRFSAEYSANGELDATGLAACTALAPGLARISGERIQTELLKLFVANQAVEVTKYLADSGVYLALFGTAPRYEVFVRLAAIEAVLGRICDGPLRLAALGIATLDDAQRLDARLKLPTVLRQRIENATKDRGVIDPAMTGEAAKVKVYRLGIARYRDAVLLAWANSGRGSDDLDFGRLFSLPDRWAVPGFPLRGGDALALGVPPGPEIGRLLERVEADWISGGFAGDRAELIERLRALSGRRSTS